MPPSLRRLQSGVPKTAGGTLHQIHDRCAIKRDIGEYELIGVGFYLPAMIGTAATLIVLGVFRTVEARFPSEFYAHHTIRFVRESIIPEQELRELIGRHGFTIANLSHRLTEMGKVFEYRMVIRTRDRAAAVQLAQYLCTVPGIIEFRITPTGD